MRGINAIAISSILLIGACAKTNWPPPPAPTNWAQIQAAVSSSPVIMDEGRVRLLIPYSSITFERTMCFGPCPVYKVTFNRNGEARLIEDHLSDNPQYFDGTTYLRDYARIAQLVESARVHSEWSEYSGQWTDDYSAKITARTDKMSWSVSDYGQVAPPEVWALEQILHQFRQSVEWKRVQMK